MEDRSIAQPNPGTLTMILARRPRLRPFIQRISVKYGGHRHKELERFIKFVVVGVIGTIVDLGIAGLLLRFVFHASRDNAGPVTQLASAISFTIAVSSNFILNRYWTYPDSRSRPIVIQLAQFFAVNIVGLGIRYLMVGLLTVPFAGLIGDLPPGILHTLTISRDVEPSIGGFMAVICSIGVVMMWNFFVNRYWTYNDVQ